MSAFAQEDVSSIMGSDHLVVPPWDHHPGDDLRDMANINGVILDLSEADQDLANNNDPNNNASDLNQEQAGMPDQNVPLRVPSPAGPVVAPDCDIFDTSPRIPDDPEPSTSRADDGQPGYITMAVAGPSTSLCQSPEGEDGGSAATSDVTLQPDVLLIMKLIPSRAYEDIYQALEARKDNPARVQVVLNELLEEAEQQSKEEQRPSTSTSALVGASSAISTNTQEVSSSNPSSDSDDEVQFKNKSGNGLKAKNSKEAKSADEGRSSAAARPPLAKRLLSLDPNLSDEDLDFQGKMPRRSISEDHSTASKRSMKRRDKRRKFELSEKHIHGPYNFLDHRGGANASCRPKPSQYSGLREDLQDIVEAGRGEASKRPKNPTTPPVVDLRKTPTPMVVDLSEADQSEKCELLDSLVNMFPETPREFLQDQAEELAGKPAAIERFINEHLARESRPPEYWIPRDQRPPEDPYASFPLKGEENAVVVDGYPEACVNSQALNLNQLKQEVVGLCPMNPDTMDEDQTAQQSALAQPAGHQPMGQDEDQPEVQLGAQANPPDPAVVAALPEDNPEDRIDGRFATTQILFPQADPEFLHQKVREFDADEEAFSRWVNESLENKGVHFPTREAYEKRQEEAEMQEKYSREVCVEDILNMYDDPEEYFGNKDRKVTNLYERHALAQLKKEFCYIGAGEITKAFGSNSKLYYPTFKVLQKHRGARRKTKRLLVECAFPQEIDLNFLKELQFSRIEMKVKAHKKRLSDLQQEKIERVRKSGGLMECGCCFNDECLPEDMLPCKGGHLFCSECVQRASQVAVGEAKTSLGCLGQCEEVFELSTLQKALKANMFSKWLRKIALAEVEQADIEGLERCPFCEFATIMEFSPEENKVFQCQNPECGKESCRLCKEISHIPLRCEEIEKDAEVRKRTFIENKMTEALIRKCWKCDKAYLKVDGCNKMTCTCGAKMCYLCRKPVIDYTHFFGQGGVSNGKQCPLWSDNKKLHEHDVAKGAMEAKKSMDEKEPAVQLKHDPTKDIREAAAFENEAGALRVMPDVLGPMMERLPRHIVAQQRVIEEQIAQNHHYFRVARPQVAPEVMMQGVNVGGAPHPPHRRHPPHHAPLNQYNLMNQMGEILEMRNQQRLREQEIQGREREALEGFRYHGRYNNPRNMPFPPVPPGIGLPPAAHGAGGPVRPAAMGEYVNMPPMAPGNAGIHAHPAPAHLHPAQTMPHPGHMVHLHRGRIAHRRREGFAMNWGPVNLAAEQQPVDLRPQPDHRRGAIMVGPVPRVPPRRREFLPMAPGVRGMAMVRHPPLQAPNVAQQRANNAAVAAAAADVPFADIQVEDVVEEEFVIEDLEPLNDLFV